MKKLISILAAAALVFSCQEIKIVVGGNDDSNDKTEQENDPGNTDDEQDNHGTANEDNAYVLVTSALEDWSGEYVIVAHDGAKYYVLGEWSDLSYSSSYALPVGGASDKVDFYNQFIDDREVSFPLDVMDPYKVKIDKDGRYYTLYLSGQGYIGAEEDKNQLHKSEELPAGNTYRWNIVWENGSADIRNAEFTNRAILWNHSASRFAAYTNQQDILLFKRSKDNGTVTPPGPGTEPDPEPELSVTVTTGEASSITLSTATISGSYTGANADVREVGFEWGLTSSLGETEQANVADRFSATLNGLGENTTYYYKAYTVLQRGNEIKYFYGAVKSFTTQRGVAPQPSGSQPGWAELPAMDIQAQNGYKVSASNSKNYYAWHISPDVKGPGNKLARNYTVCYSAEHHCPLWVAAPRHAMYVGSSGRNDSYRVDPDIPSNIQYSSKSTGGGCNKGHMLGSAERTCSKETNRQVFFYTNIAPQLSSGFNTGGGGWNLLEDYMDTQVCKDTLYEVVGCYFERFTDGYGKTQNPSTIEFGDRSDVSMPTMFYYAVLRTKKGNTGKSVKDCSADELQCVAFVRAHVNTLKGQKPSAKELMSIADLEKITGFTYFSNVPNAPKNTYSAADWGL